MLHILATPLTHFSLKGWENVLFELRSERVNQSFKSYCLSRVLAVSKSGDSSSEYNRE